MKNATVIDDILALSQAEAAASVPLTRSSAGYILTFMMRAVGAGAVCAMLLDHRRRFVKFVYMRRGREELHESMEELIIRECAQLDVAYFIIAHNHFSGPLVPSPEDIFTTDMLRRRFSGRSPEFLEHYIVSGFGYITLSGAAPQGRCYS